MNVKSITLSMLAAVAFAAHTFAATPAAPAAAPAAKSAPAAAAPAAEAKTTKAAKATWAKGTVVSADAIGNTLTVKEKKGDVVYTLEKDAKITKAGAAGTMDDLKAETAVKIKFKHEGDKLVATAVEIPKAKAAAQAPAAK